MTAALRYDIGQDGAEAIAKADPGILDCFGARTVSRWAGVSRPRHVCCTFAVKLPRQAAQAWRLLLLVDRLQAEADGGVARNSCATLRHKLHLALGLPVVGTALPAERAFLDAIGENPGDVGNWSGYADWLQERAESDMQRRGLVIAGWLGPKAIKVRYGVPVIAKEKS